MRTMTLVLAALLLHSAVGCGRSSRVPVTGVVTFDGVPVEEGAISFVPTDGISASDGATIKNGVFAAEVTPGDKRVEIRASRAIPPWPNDPESVNFREDFLPATFNSETTLSAEVVGNQENTLEFDLKP